MTRESGMIGPRVFALAATSRRVFSPTSARFDERDINRALPMCSRRAFNQTPRVKKGQARTRLGRLRAANRRSPGTSSLRSRNFAGPPMVISSVPVTGASGPVQFGCGNQGTHAGKSRSPWRGSDEQSNADERQMLSDNKQAERKPVYGRPASRTLGG